MDLPHVLEGAVVADRHGEERVEGARHLGEESISASHATLHTTFHIITKYKASKQRRGSRTSLNSFILKPNMTQPMTEKQMNVSMKEKRKWTRSITALLSVLLMIISRSYRKVSGWPKQCVGPCIPVGIQL